MIARAFVVEMQDCVRVVDYERARPLFAADVVAFDTAVARILIVDDDPALRGIVADALREDGYAVDSARNGLEALNAFRKHRPDAMVLDLAMPVMDGPTLVRTLRDQTRWGGVPLVVLSGQSQPQMMSDRLGAQACLEKPVDLLQLIESIEAIALP
jgi:CheY-like chemotaxis protein